MFFSSFLQGMLSYLAEKSTALSNSKLEDFVILKEYICTGKGVLCIQEVLSLKYTGHFFTPSDTLILKN